MSWELHRKLDALRSGKLGVCATFALVLKLLQAGDCSVLAPVRSHHSFDLAAQRRQKVAVEQKRAVRMRLAIIRSHHGHDWP